MCHPKEKLESAGKGPHSDVEFDGLSLLEAQIQFGSLLQVLGLPGQLVLLPHPPVGIKSMEKETSQPTPGSSRQINPAQDHPLCGSSSAKAKV